ncbi:MAG: hypothetical protein ACM31P_03390 [Actinomycetota bacterium]
MNYFLEKTDKVSVDVRTLRLLIGGIAIGLAILVQVVSPWPLTSISGSYFAGDWPRNFFVGCLFFIAGFLFAYNGLQRIEAWLSKFAAIAAIGVATFPCECQEEAKHRGTTMLQCLGESADRYDTANVSSCLLHFQEIKGAHYLSALVMFGILAAFCAIFYLRAKEKKKKNDLRHTAARRRMYIYSICLVSIVSAIVSLLVDYFTGRISAEQSTFIFWAEFLGLVSFGTSWITASYIVPGLAREGVERYHPLRPLKSNVAEPRP